MLNKPYAIPPTLPTPTCTLIFNPTLPSHLILTYVLPHPTCTCAIPHPTCMGQVPYPTPSILTPVPGPCHAHLTPTCAIPDPYAS